jgi:hypothetical protein
MTDVTGRLEGLLALLERQIEELEELGAQETAKLLRIARLDLKMRMHNVSDKELRELCAAIERQTAPPESARVIAFPSTPVRRRRRIPSA